MSAVTYSGTVSWPVAQVLITNSPPGITATFSGADPASKIPVNFTLQNNVSIPGGTATLKASFIPPTWPLNIAQNVPPTFTIWSNGIATTTVLGAISATSVGTESSTSSSVTVSASETSQATQTTNSTSETTKSIVTSTFAPLVTITSSSTPLPKPPVGYSSGALAGAAVGCLVGGLLIAAVLAMLWFRHRSRSSALPEVVDKDSATRDIAKESLIIGPDTKQIWQMDLPQPDSDQSISRLASRTLDDIELFVENFYCDKSTGTTNTALDDELALFTSPCLDKPLGELLQTVRNPTVLMKHCIAYFLLQKIDPSCNDMMSLLPREYIVPKPSGTLQPSNQQAMSQIRVLMAHSRLDPALDEQYRLQRDRAANKACEQIERVFQPWTRGDLASRSKNLHGVLIHLSELGIKLFAQPSAFEWQWGRDSAEAVMLPGLDKVTDLKGVPLAEPISLVRPRPGLWSA